MTQVTSGLRSILTSATIYRAFQDLMGARAARATFVREYVRPFAGAQVLDVGCGPADLLEFLPPEVNYWGFDISQRYIDSARERHGSHGHFFAKEFTPADLATLPSIDMVLATGLFHHLDDTTAEQLLRLIQRALKPGGRLVTLDGVFHPGQNPIARGLIALDRGRHVRTQAGYLALFSRAFPAPRLEIRSKSWPSYTYFLAECTRPDPGHGQ